MAKTDMPRYRPRTRCLICGGPAPRPKVICLDCARRWREEPEGGMARPTAAPAPTPKDAA
jgi:hypothetical protein